MLSRLQSIGKLAAFAVVFSLPAWAFAWGVEGHQITCLIAEDHLTPAALAGIHQLLGAGTNISDAEIAAWADEHRREDNSTAPWHYANIPTTAEVFNEARDGDDGNNVVDKIPFFEKIVADRSRTKAERATALKYLVHFVGDAHQPLHCADRDGDKGGNTRLVFYPGKSKAMNLHSVWDAAIIVSLQNNMPIAKFADGLNAKITKTELADWQKGTSLDWVNESHAVAVRVTYDGIPANGPPPRLSMEYLRKSATVIQEQLEKGGVRLAMVLNRVFPAS